MKTLELAPFVPRCHFKSRHLVWSILMFTGCNQFVLRILIGSFKIFNQWECLKQVSYFNFKLKKLNRGYSTKQWNQLGTRNYQKIILFFMHIYPQLTLNLFAYNIFVGCYLLLAFIIFVYNETCIYLRPF